MVVPAHVSTAPTASILSDSRRSALDRPDASPLRVNLPVINSLWRFDSASTGFARSPEHPQSVLRRWRSPSQNSADGLY